MNILQLEYAIALKKYGNFTRSSAHIGITQPALSLQIKNLEEEIGIALFDRSKVPVVPTEDGEKFLKRAQEIVTMSNDLKDYANSLKNEYKGILKVGIIPTLSPFLVPLFVGELASRFPELTLDIKESLTEEILNQIKNGAIDAGIISTPIDDKLLEVKPILYEQFFYYSPQDLDSISLSKLWLLEEGNCFRDQVNDICGLSGVNKSDSMIYRSNSIDSLVRIVEYQGGTTILPELTTLSLSENQESYLLKIEGKVREISIIHRASIDKLRFIDAVQQAILANVPSRMHSAGGMEIVNPGIKLN